MLDGEGQRVTDPAEGFNSIYSRDVGGLTRVGGVEAMSSYKHYGLAMMVHILGGTLSGASFPPIRKRTQRADQLTTWATSSWPWTRRHSSRMAGSPPTSMTPSTCCTPPRRQTRELRQRDGTPLPDTLIEKLRGMCASCGAASLLVN